MAIGTYLLVSLFFTLCLGQFQALDFQQKVCLYSSASTKVLTPLQLTNANCPSNTANCMSSLYKYGNFQYGGPAALKPQAGEVVMFLSQDQAGKIDYVSFLNAKKDTTLKVFAQITGAEPVPILLKDDPDNDSWLWDEEVNSGNFTWITKPGYTDGVVIGHITFIDNYCVRSSYSQPNAAIDKISIMSGTVANPVRILTVNYTSGSIFEFCQYPKTASTFSDVSCPGRSDGSASISIVFGPPNVQYRWYNEAGTIVGTTASITNVPAGIYHVYVNDTGSNGCTADRTITIRQPTLLPATVSRTTFTCATKGSASATPRGGSGGFTFQWLKQDMTTVIGTGSSINNLEVGQYYVRVTDSCGSTATTAFSIVSIGCCGDGMCGTNEACGTSNFCAADCGMCCAPGTFVDGATCTVCPAGSRSTTYQAASCTPCPANTFNAGASETCVACPNNYMSAAGSGKCMRCPAGQVRMGASPSCAGCGLGSFASPCDNAVCSSCPAGTYAEMDNRWSCSACPPGTYSSAGASGCQACGNDEYSGAMASSCTACPEGTTYRGPAGGATTYLHCN